MLLARVDAALRDDGEPCSDDDTKSEVCELTDSLIDGLYKQA
jgi:hypothetical protein